MEENKSLPEQAEDVIELFDIVESVDAETAGKESPEGTSSLSLTEDALHVDSEEVSTEENSPMKESKPCSLSAEDKEISSDDSKENESEPPLKPGEIEENDSCSELDEKLKLLEQQYRQSVCDLKERIDILERCCGELAENIENLSQQLAHAGSLFLEDASVRIPLEELISHMLDMRMPPIAESEGKEETDSSLAMRMDALERTMQNMDKRGEQMAALAAAKVIREEIEAMKAEASTHPFPD